MACGRRETAVRGEYTAVVGREYGAVRTKRVVSGAECSEDSLFLIIFGKMFAEMYVQSVMKIYMCSTNHDILEKIKFSVVVLGMF